MENDQAKLKALMGDTTNWDIEKDATNGDAKDLYHFKAGAPEKSTCWTFDGKEEIKFYKKTTAEGASSEKNWDIEKSARNSLLNEGTKYTHRFKSNGSNNKVQITITAPALISIEAMSSDAAEKTIAMSLASNKNTTFPELNGLTTLPAADDNHVELRQYLLNEPGSYRWGTTSNGYNVYYVSVHYLAAETPAA